MISLQYDLYKDTDLTKVYQFKNDIELKTQLNNYMHLTEIEYNDVLSFVQTHNMKQKQRSNRICFVFEYNQYSTDVDEKIKIKLFLDDVTELKKRIRNLSTCKSSVGNKTTYSIYVHRVTECYDQDNQLLLERWTNGLVGRPISF